MTTPDPKKPCPSCKKNEGQLVNRTGFRFPYAVQCKACGWSTDFVRIPAVAVKLWDEAKA